MMGWQDPKITVMMTCCELCTPHNIVNIGPPTTGASSAACKYHLRSSCKPQLAPGGLSWPLLHFCCISHEWESEGKPSVLYMLLKPSVAVGQTLNYQKYLSRILEDNAPNSTAGNINIVNVDLIDEGIEVAYLPTIMTFTCYGKPTENVGNYDGVASVALAMEHLNTGNGSIIPEISGLNETCPLRFTIKSFDLECSQLAAVNHVISLTDRSMSWQLYATAILGDTSSSISMPTSMISSLRDVPQFSPDATSSDLDNKDQLMGHLSLC
eukprot:scaffold9944_cov52-Cyclotella_meneghiniana.AAC.2